MNALLVLAWGVLASTNELAVGDRGGITYPEDGSRYDNNEQEQWVINCTDVVYLTWQKFDLEARYDFLRITHDDGVFELESFKWPRSLTGPLTLDFTSDGSVVKTGFSMEWSCGVNHAFMFPAGSTGRINYPASGLYPNHAVEYFNISCEGTVHFVWERFDVEVLFDKLTIVSLIDSSNLRLDNSRTRPPRMQGPLFLLFQSDLSVMRKGFAFRWQCGDREAGCFQTHPRFLSERVEQADTNNRPASCAVKCTDLSYLYAGVEGGQCLCGNSLTGSRKTAATKCNVACPGDSMSTCGGTKRISLHRLPGAPDPPPAVNPSPIGCFKDEEENRRLKYIYGTALNTVEECTDVCRHNGYTHAGLQSGNQCWCGQGSQVASSERALSTECDTACTGDASATCGGHYRNNIYVLSGVVAEEPQPSLVGCYRDGASNRKFERAGDSEELTVNECAVLCRHNGYKYAGLQSGSECWCGQDISTSERLVTSACDAPCTGNANEKCGAAFKNSVYLVDGTQYTPPAAVYKGCYKDASARTLPKYAYSSYWNTVEECTAVCKAQGYTFAGMQARLQCWCGNALPPVPRSERECRAACRGNPSQICGGHWRNSVYQLL